MMKLMIRENGVVFKELGKIFDKYCKNRIFVVFYNG